MSKTIKVIDLLNKIANGEIKEGQRFIIHFKEGLTRDIFYRGWESEKTSISSLRYYSNNNVVRDEYDLNDTVEIIEEEPEIDIQEIEETEIKNDGRMDYFKYCNDGATESGYGVNYSKSDIATRKIINELIKAIKQLDKKIKEK